MGLSLVYLGKQGGGSQFAQAVYDALGPTDVKLIVSDKNSDKFQGEVSIISEVPSGILENILILFRPKKMKILLSCLASKIGKDTVIFLMPHPVDFPLRKKLQSNQVYIVIHDAKKHHGDIWPTNKTIKRMAKSKATKIFLSSHVMNSSAKFSLEPKILLPLLMGKIEDEDLNNRDLDIAILGRHKKYKNFNLQKLIINKLGSRYLIFASIPNGTQNDFYTSPKIILREGWISTQEFQEILRRTKTLILTHQEASQSGLVLDAVRFGACPIIPNVTGLNTQAEYLKLPWIYNPSELENLTKQIDSAIAQPELLIDARKIVNSDPAIWRQYFRTLL